MTRFTLIFALLFLSSSASAQSIDRRIDLSSLGWGAINPQLIEADGNPKTEEWAVQGEDMFSGTYGQWRVVAVQADGLCAGDWFNPAPTSAEGLTTPGTVTLGKDRDGRHKLFIVSTTWQAVGNRFEVRQLLTVRNLDRPECQ